MYTEVITLEDFLVGKMKQGSRVLPLVLGCFPCEMARSFDRYIREKASTQNICLGTIAFQEYRYGVVCGNIPTAIPFDKYYTDGEIPDLFGLSMLLCLMDRLSVEKYDAAYLYLYYVIDHMAGPM